MISDIVKLMQKIWYEKARFNILFCKFLLEDWNRCWDEPILARVYVNYKIDGLH